MNGPLAIDLFSGLGGWTEGLLSEGYSVVGFDIERHIYGEQKYPAQLVLQDVRTIHGSQFKNAALIVASPPCQEYSYMAMPFSRGKRIAAALRGQGEFPDGYTGSRTIEELNALFNACFRIQHEASEAAGHHVPMVVENVKGAQPWVGKAKANFGSFYLWGDVEMVGNRIYAGGIRLGESVRAAKRGSKNTGGSWFAVAHNTTSGHSNCPDGRKVPGMNFHEHEKTGMPGRSFQSAAVDGLKGIDPTGDGERPNGTGGSSWFFNQRADPRDMRRNEDGDFTPHGLKRPGQSISDGFNNWPKDDDGAYMLPDGTKVGGSGADWFDHGPAALSSRSQARKAASAQIAKIPFPLSSYIARAYRPTES